MKIGFIGLGIMGSRMATNLQKHGYQLIVHNRTPEKANPLLSKGAIWAENPASVAKQCDILITMLAHPKAVSEAALGDQGFLNALSPKKLWIDSSTVNPSFSRQMAQQANTRNIRFLDAPVAGSKLQAASANLVFIVGGKTTDLAEAQPLFDCMGKRTLHIGSIGMGSSMKLVINQLLAVSMAAFAEGMTLGESLGIPKETLMNILIGGPVVPPFMASKKDMMQSHQYETQFPLRWMQKDLQMSTQTAYETQTPMPIANITKEVFQQAIKAGFGDNDFASIYQFLSQ